MTSSPTRRDPYADEDDDCIDFSDEDYDDDDKGKATIDVSLKKKSKREMQRNVERFTESEPGPEKRTQAEARSAEKKRVWRPFHRASGWRKAILEASSEPGWSNHWRHEGFYARLWPGVRWIAAHAGRRLRRRCRSGWEQTLGQGSGRSAIGRSKAIRRWRYLGPWRSSSRHLLYRRCRTRTS